VESEVRGPQFENPYGIGIVGFNVLLETLKTPCYVTGIRHKRINEVVPRRL